MARNLHGIPSCPEISRTKDLKGDQGMDRRTLLKFTAAGVASVTAGKVVTLGALAQEASPAAVETANGGTPAPQGPLYTAAELGLGELLIRQTDGGFEAPSEVAAGRYLLTVENASSIPFGGAGFIQAPEGQTTADVQAAFEEVNAYFAALEAGTPPVGEDPTAFLYEAVVIGGPAVGGPGSFGQAVIDLPAGEYVIWNEDFTSPTATMTVTGEMPAGLPEMTTSATVTAINVEDHFDFTVDGQPVAGRQLIEFFNDSDQPHFLWLMNSPAASLTDEQWLELMTLAETGGTPAPDSGLPSIEDVIEVGGTTSQSQGQTMWWAVDLAPGNYGIFCFIPDPRHQGAPHSAMGMIGSFTIE
jgi:hypothetical protein